MSPDPYTCAWLIESEDRTPEVVLEANLDHWNRAARGPRVQRAVFRNTLSPSRALDLCLNGDGEVDIVTEVDPSDAARVEASEHARLVAGDLRTALDVAVEVAVVPDEVALAGARVLVETKLTYRGNCSSTAG